MISVLNLFVMLLADIQFIRHLLQRQSVFLTKGLYSLSKFCLVEIHFLSFPQSRRRLHLRTKRTSMHFQKAEQKKKHRRNRIIEQGMVHPCSDSASYGAW